jgi:murein DD-endopeptidase MepM/ murein hydrolase activator NlpD
MRGRGRRALRGSLVLVALVALVVVASAQKSHTIQRGETLTGIAERYGTTVQQIVDANRLTNPDGIVAGRTLTIPSGSASSGSSGDASTQTHVVQRGDTLSGIAARYGTTVDRIRELSGLLPGDTLMSGTRLTVAGPPPPSISSGGGSGGSHTIERGETLSEIAKRYGVALTTIAEMNRISDPDLILAGATLNLPGGEGWRCPVDGQIRFINDFGLAKPAGTRFHDGVDLFADRGTPVVAPVSGEVSQIRGPRAGLQFTLRGDDGHTYIGTHLDSFGESGRVSAGTVIGTVGSTGNAIGSPPHLHFEIHAEGDRIINPYPTLVEACR